MHNILLIFGAVCKVICKLVLMCVYLAYYAYYNRSMCIKIHQIVKICQWRREQANYKPEAVPGVLRPYALFKIPTEFQLGGSTDQGTPAWPAGEKPLQSARGGSVKSKLHGREVGLSRRIDRSWVDLQFGVTSALRRVVTLS